AGVIAKFESGGTTIPHPSLPSPLPPPTLAGPGAQPAPVRPQPPPSGGTANLQWPGSLQRTVISVSNETGGQPVTLERGGFWHLFKMLEAGSLKARADTATAEFSFQGQDLRYQFNTNAKNPLDLSTLRRFECPSNI